jgi:hypothetical protein
MPRDPIWSPADIEKAARDPAVLPFVPARQAGRWMRAQRAPAVADAAPVTPAGHDPGAFARAVAEAMVPMLRLGLAEALARDLAPLLAQMVRANEASAEAGVEGGPSADDTAAGVPSGAAEGSDTPLAPFPDADAARDYLASRGVPVRRAAGGWWHGDQEYDDAGLIAWATRKRARALRREGEG